MEEAAADALEMAAQAYAGEEAGAEEAIVIFSVAFCYFQMVEYRCNQKSLIFGIIKLWFCNLQAADEGL